MGWEEVSKVFQGRPVLTPIQLSNIIGKSLKYTDQVIHRWASSNKITRIERGKYTIYNDPLLYASSIIWPSYLSIWNSLSYHNLTEQIPHSFWVVTTRHRKKTVINIMNAQIFFIRTDPRQFFGYEKIVKDGIEIFMADREKTIIDCLLFNRVSISDLQEMIRIKSTKINKRRLIAYSLRTQNAALMKRIGYMLDQNGYDSFPKFKDNIYNQITSLDPNLPNRGMVEHKWKIKDNVGT